MAIKNVLRMGAQRLSVVSEAVTRFDTPQLDSLIEDMVDTMLALNGAGLAAPQIGVNQRVVIFGLEQNERYPDAEKVPFTILVNPQIEVIGAATEDQWEGCLSLPGMRGLVPRYLHIQYSGFDQKGRQLQRNVTGFHARVVQHECDHLDGVLYPQRMTDMSNFGFREELEASGRLTPAFCDD